MNSTNFRKQMLGAGSALRVLAMVGAGAAASTVAITPAAAQDYTTGAITGTVTDDSGATVSGATVTVTSQSRGFSRTSTTSSNGNYRFSNLETGQYDIEVSNGGTVGYRAEGVRVIAGQSNSIDIMLAATSGDVITVIGSQIANDFEGSTTGLNVDLEELVKTVPITRDLTSVVLLAPGTTGGDSAFGSLASVGGSSVAENAYYVNGLNITNFDNYLGSARVPFEFYRTVEVKSGGYPAEFGRATGGIINTVTKSGSNDFFAAAHLNWAPNFLQSYGEDLLNCDYTNYDPDTFGTPAQAPLIVECPTATNRALDTGSSYSAIIEAGGPIIEDRLFVYGLVELRETKSTTVSRSGGFVNNDVQNDPFWGVKVDAYPLDNHHLEFTIFDSRRTTQRSVLDYSEGANGGVIGTQTGQSEFNFGGVSYVGKYTGTLTDWLTVSAAYGKMRDRFDVVGIGASATDPYFVNVSGTTQNGFPNGSLMTAQTLTNTDQPYRTEREFYRADADLYFTALGDHHIRFGVDQETNTLDRSTVRNGGDTLLAAGLITQAAYDAGGGGAGYALVARAGDIVELNYFNSGGSFTSKNRSYYIQDEWQLTDRLTLNLGLRRDDFRVNGADGQPIANLKENYAPRLGFSYDLWDDKSGKLYGYFGQYFLPIASNTAFRQAGSEFFIRERYQIAGYSSNGLPILGAQVTGLSTYQNACPFGLAPSSNGVNCNVTGDGSVPPTDTTIAANLEATRQSEYIIGYEHKFGDITIGLNYIHRNLDVTAEDAAIDAAVLNYCDEQEITGCSATWTGFHQYTILNPGNDLTVALDGLDGRTVTFTAEELGYGTAKRRYDAVELTFAREWDGNWSLGGSYTWSESYGNSEGYVQSDFGQDDAGITQDFDQPGFTDFAEGYLPNHRRHRFKLFGAVALSDRFTLGTNIDIASPRPLSCFGFHPTDQFANGYNQASHYCGGEPAPRGEGFKTDWQSTFDVSARYNIEIPTGQTITFRADVFNLFNSQGITQRSEIGDYDLIERDTDMDPTTPDDVLYPADPQYGQSTGFQAPRSVRLGLDISF